MIINYIKTLTNRKADMHFFLYQKRPTGAGMQSKLCGYFILKENNRNIENTFAFRFGGSPQKELVNIPGDTLADTMRMVGDSQLRTPVATAPVRNGFRLPRVQTLIQSLFCR